MPNPIAYNYTGALGKNILKPGYTTVCIGINGPNEPNYSVAYNGLTWRNSIELGGGGIWALYSNDYSQGVQPTQSSGLAVGWTCNDNNTDLKILLDSIPERSHQSPFGSIDDAISWVTGNGNYLILNREYPSIAFKTSLMILGYDPASTISYPRVGSQVWDITGNLSSSASMASVSVQQDSTPFFFDFTGSGDITIPAGLDQLITNTYDQAFTVSVWINANNLSSDSTILQIKGSSAISPTNWFKMYVDSTTGQLKIDCMVNESNNVSASFTFTPSTSTNYHLCLVMYFSGGRLYGTLYVDGGTPETRDFGGITPSNFVATGASSVSHIGNIDGIAEYFGGYIGPLHIYSGVLTSGDVQTLYDTLLTAYGY
jgi:hypothetical protein